jgi:hypothetical protein
MSVGIYHFVVHSRLTYRPWTHSFIRRTIIGFHTSDHVGELYPISQRPSLLEATKRTGILTIYSAVRILLVGSERWEIVLILLKFDPKRQYASPKVIEHIMGC